MTDLMKIDRLLRRPQFLAAAKGVSQARGAVVIQQLDRADGDPSVRLGFTATRKIGGAVVRNRAKRRLREAARLLTPLHGRAGCDYVFIARMGTADRDWDRLLDDVKSALTRLATPRAAPDMGERAVSPAPIPTRAPSDPRPADQDR
ncbi:ribonuclease P protein component [Brevundimonas diminuta]|uniref:ribonuclease P protein component n=1 Tax=Brevundimonas TaxID=41275 RepID=UPI0002A1CE40|nr:MULTISPECIES: ribonuclease P protein component [Brevundimonas]EKY30590.1 ribonuclease P protein component [Brevundimonas diminuta 470-4]MCO8019728.1 ribonuclease P protein component [Brevundimonas diminuta]MCO8023003.1 ribonuclease P protein component [Brevundimonas diminuta]